MSPRAVFGIPLTMDIFSIFSSGCRGWSLSINDVEVYHDNLEDYVVNTNRSEDFISAATLSNWFPTTSTSRKRKTDEGRSLNSFQGQPGERRITLEQFIGDVNNLV